MEIKNIVENFKGKKILIVGDVMLDKYVEGNVNRISAEAPVPILAIEKEFYNAGGAGNVALNVASLGGKATLFSFAGKDKEGFILTKILKSRRVKYVFDKSKNTPLKTRLVCKGQQLMRFDKEDISGKNFSNEKIKLLIENAKNSDIIIISDYAKGTINNKLIDALYPFKNKIIVDPKPSNKISYSGFLLLTPNEKEVFEMSKEKEIDQAGLKLKSETGSNVLVTRGEKGMKLFSDKVMEIPTYAREVYDVSGAGDTVIAALSLSLASGAKLDEAAIIANHAAGIAVERKGTYAVKLRELKERISKENRKIISMEEAKSIISKLRKKGKKIVWTNGCFDLLHVGHTRYLKGAKELGDLLFVGLNSDSSVRELKGPSRPIQNENERAEILASLEFVDYIIIFPEKNVERYLTELKPNVYAKGGDYKIDTINQIERKIVESYNGNISIIPLVEGKSTTKTIEKLNARKNTLNNK